MPIRILSPRSIRYMATHCEALFAPADGAPSSFHLLGAALATCTHAILSSWAATVRLDASTLAIEVSWAFAEHPHRAEQFAVRINLPTLPAARVGAAERVALLCPVHATLTETATIGLTILPRSAVVIETREPSLVG